MGLKSYWHALDILQLLVDPSVQLDIGEALDIVSTDPVPGRLPGYGVPAQTD